jgi:hypothetical protein
MRSVPLLLALTVLAPIRPWAQDLSSLPGTYEAIQRVAERTLNSEGVGRHGDSTGEGTGLMGQPVTGTLTLAADNTFTIAMAYFDEGTWQALNDEKGKGFLRFTGKRDSFDAVYQGEYGLGVGELGLWVQEGNEWFLIQFRKSTEPGTMPSDPYSANEAALASMFGQGDVKVDFAEVKKGSASGVRVQQGVFSKGTRFGTPDTAKDPATHSDARVVLTFLPDGRFTIVATATGTTKNGTYVAEGSQLRLKLEGGEQEESWEIGRDSISGKFAIRPAGSGGAFLMEVPLE